MILKNNKTILTDAAFSNLVSLTHLNINLNRNETILTEKAFFNLDKLKNIYFFSDDKE